VRAAREPEDELELRVRPSTRPSESVFALARQPDKPREEIEPGVGDHRLHHEHAVSEHAPDDEQRDAGDEVASFNGHSLHGKMRIRRADRNETIRCSGARSLEGRAAQKTAPARPEPPGT
jgi:hypothetical protein